MVFSIRCYKQALFFSIAFIFSRPSMGNQALLAACFGSAQDEISGVYVSQQDFQEEKERQQALQIIDIIVRNDRDAIAAMKFEELNAERLQLYIDRASLVRHYNHKDPEGIPDEFVGLWLGGYNALGFALFYTESIDPADVASHAQAVETIKLLLARGLSVQRGLGIAYFARDKRDGSIRDYVPLCNCTEKYVSPELLQLLVQHGFILKHHLHRFC